MFSLFRKEVSTFFCSLTGYLVIAVFLLACGLFLWVVPGDLNILYSGYASLEPLFAIAPWIYLFLVPAVSMRLIAEERHSGTLELLLIRPVRVWQIVMAKYLAGFVLVMLTIAPTIVYVFIVSYLGSPVGNIDLGGTIGSYLGLIALAAIYMAVGIFASSLTDSQIVAFVVAMVLCFVVYTGFDYIAQIPAFAPVASVIEPIGIEYHYASISRGVVDSRDVVYFLSVAALFVALTCMAINRRK